jgi:hypothetical protein
MGILNSKGQISGRVGDRIYYVTQNGKQACRIAPKRSTCKPTAAQIRQRKRFGFAGTFISAFLPLFHILPKSVIKKRYPYPTAIKQALAEAISGEDPHLQIDYSKVRLFQGQVVNFSRCGVKKSDDGLEFYWSVDDRFSRCSGLILVAYHPASNRILYEAVRLGSSDSSHIISLPVDAQDDHFETWMVLVLYDGNTAGGSVYCGSTLTLSPSKHERVESKVES